MLATLAFVSSCEYQIGFILAWARETAKWAAYQMTLRWEMLSRSLLSSFGCSGIQQ